MKRCIVLAALGGLLATFCAGGASAASVKWTAVAGSPPVTLPLKVLRESIIPEINSRIAAENKNFKIEWVEAYSQSLAKFTEVFEAVEENIAQFGLQFTNFEESKLPLEQYTRAVPFASRDPEITVELDAKLRRSVPRMDEMWVEHKQYRLSSAAGAAMQLFSTFPVHKLADVKGRKIGASGSYANYLRNTGAVAVNATMFNAYNDVRSGLYDGYVVSIGLAFPFKHYQVMKFASDIGFASNMTPTISVNKGALDALPGWVQRIVRDVGAQYGQRYAKLEKARSGKFKAIMAKQGVKFTDLPREERKRWAMALPNLPKAWAESVERRNLPGRKVLSVFMNELRARKIDTMRDWDKE